MGHAGGGGVGVAKRIELDTPKMRVTDRGTKGGREGRGSSEEKEGKERLD